MSDWAPKRFWTSTSVEAAGDGYEVRLDGRPLRTPAKAGLILPTRALGERLAAEWDAQGDVVDPGTMPATRMANSAIDKVGVQRAAVLEHIASYGGSDLLCYRAEGPEGLVAAQAREWDPWLDWAEATFGARLRVTQGILPVPQPEEARRRLSARIAPLGLFELAGLHDLVGLSGSLVLGLAVAHGAADADAIWETARLDERWQIEQWGADEEAERVNAARQQAFSDAAEFFAAARES